MIPLQGDPGRLPYFNERNYLTPSTQQEMEIFVVEFFKWKILAKSDWLKGLEGPHSERQIDYINTMGSSMLFQD